MVMKVKEGDVSMKGQPIFVIEAMKMESTINSNVEGTVKKTYLNLNTMVE
jgi:pyruvate carboxylase